MLYFQNKMGSSLKSRVFEEKRSTRARLKGILTIHTYTVYIKHIPDFARSTPNILSRSLRSLTNKHPRFSIVLPQ